MVEVDALRDGVARLRPFSALKATRSLIGYTSGGRRQRRVSRKAMVENNQGQWIAALMTFVLFLTACQGIDYSMAS